MSLSNVNISPILREMGEDGWDRKMMVDGHPLLASLRVDTDGMTGDYFKVPIQHGKPTGRSHSPSVAYANEVASKYSAFKVQHVSDYLHFRLDGITVRKGKNSNGATSFVDAVEQEVFSALEAAGDNIAKEAYGNHGGARARVHASTAISTTSLTLENPADAIFFAAGMKIGAASTDGTSGALRGSPTYVTLASVNLETGVLVATANWSTITGITNSDYLFQEGDFGAAATGADSWNPGTAVAAATTLHQVDRSVAPSFLGGMRHDGQANGDTMETVFISADAKMRLQTGNPFKQVEIYINPQSMGSLRNAKEGSRFIDDSNEYKLGIAKFRTPSGHVLVEDRDAPVGRARAIGKGCFWQATNGDQPALANADGVEMVYDQQNDRFSAEVVIDHNFLARPQGLMNILLPTG